MCISWLNYSLQKLGANKISWPLSQRLKPIVNLTAQCFTLPIDLAAECFTIYEYKLKLCWLIFHQSAVGFRLRYCGAAILSLFVVTWYFLLIGNNIKYVNLPTNF